MSLLDLHNTYIFHKANKRLIIIYCVKCNSDYSFQVLKGRILLLVLSSSSNLANL